MDVRSESRPIIPRRSAGARIRRVLLGAGFIYFAVVVMLALFQRSLIYFPVRQQRIEPEWQPYFEPGQAHTVTLTADDGVVLHGWHVLPTTKSKSDESKSSDVVMTDAEARARLRESGLVVLYFSGNAGNREYRGPICRTLAQMNCHVLLFDYRGYGDNEGQPSEELLAADARQVWRYATETCGVAPERIVLYGESLGGGVAVRLAAEVEQEGAAPGGMILQSTFSSLVDAASHHFPWAPVGWALVDRYPSRDRIGSVHCPYLHLHGARDTIVPLALGRSLFEAAPAASARGIPKQFIELAGADHNDVFDVAYQPAVAAIREFLKRLAGE